MARRAPASCKPWAMDQAMLRLLATPNTTATRPSRLKGILPPGKLLRKEKRIPAARDYAPVLEGWQLQRALTGRTAWGLARVGGRWACWLLLRIQPGVALGVSGIVRKL